MKLKELQFDDVNLKLYLEDCFTGMKKYIEKKSVDVIVTSPPYNIGVGYNRYNDNIPREEYLNWLGEWAEITKQVLNDNGSLFLNIGSKPSDPWVPFEVVCEMRKHFKLQNVIHWIKSIYIEHESYGNKIELNVGHYKPINSKRFINDTHEYVFHLTKTGKVELDRLAVGVPYKDESNITRWNNGKTGLRCRGNSWYIPYKTIQNRAKDRPHPASFPSELAEMCIKLHGLERTNLVLDPFLGIGNTAIACKKLKKNFIGFEIDETYYNEAIRLLEGLNLG
ncbi:MAG: hypothetical protein PWQ82_271 [Thermosediminibacterales bacterium]|nr:hypothetical protein [Thermosediminibacterales bacterium]MDK2835294.1 hypothetical protein [Thermosediminibacterales bacterium]